MIQLIDLNKQYLSIRKEIDAEISEVIEKSQFIGGEKVQIFEENFANFIGVNNCCSCANGTDSLEIILKSMEIGINDEVIVPAISWISTSEAVSHVGATPVFVDVDPEYYTIDIDKIEEKITSKTKAIIPVHLYGQPVDMHKLIDVANKHRLKVIEDCAQAHGAEFSGKKVGSWGDCASFSFYPGKNLGAFGDAGCMVTNNEEIAKNFRMIANHGQLGRHNHIIEGRNSRLDTIQAAVLNVKLKYLTEWNSQRNIAARKYFEYLNNINVKLPKIQPQGKHVFHLFVVRIKNRNYIKEKLYTKGIHTAIHYPKALPFLDCYKNNQHTFKSFPNATEIQEQILSLPIYPEIEDNTLQIVSSELIKIL